MKTKEILLSELKWAENDAAELSDSISELANRIASIHLSLQTLGKNEPLTTTIKTSDAAAIKSWLKNLRRVYALFYTDPSPELDRLIDLLPEV